MPKKDALKKVKLIVLVVILDLSLFVNLCSASNATESRARQIEKQRTNENILVSQRPRPQMLGSYFSIKSLHNQQNNEESDSNSDDDYVVNKVEMKEEENRENKDLEDMAIKAVWEEEK